MKRRKWTDEMLVQAVAESRSVRQTMQKLGLVPAGGNYVQVREHIRINKLDTSHFLGQGWNKGKQNTWMPTRTLEDILVTNSSYQSFKLKKRLFAAEIKKVECEECGWKKVSEDGRIPLELDHINGVRTDNRLENLRILCPNCHSLKPTHRGRNKKRA
jgi:5-methylcytosine-specific restriction endonuclease McrA